MRSVIIVLFLMFCSLEGREIDVILRSIPPKDKEKIEFLFAYLVQKDNLGFVLFGKTKPAAFCSIPIVCNYPLVPASTSEAPLQYQKRLKRSWEVWSRYREKFKHPNIIICEEYEHFLSGAFLQLFFIDKRKLAELLHQYRGDFAEVLGDNFAPEDFIYRVENKRKLRPLLHYDEKLLGLILGFGKESAAGFKNMQNGKEEDTDFKMAGHRPKGCCIVPVSFRANPHSTEVKALIAAYTREILEIERIFKSDSFLTVTLAKFCAP